MKKILMVLTAAIILTSCGNTTVSEETSKRQQLQQYKQELHEIQQNIATLESELASSEEVEEVKVKIIELKNETFEHFIEVTGEVEAEQDVNVSPEMAGVITEVLVTEGQNVSKGEVLAKLSSEILERTVDELTVQQELVIINYQRQKNLWDQNIGSEMEYLQAKNSKESLEKKLASLNSQIEMANIKSPVSGVVDVVYQKKGHIGSPQIPFAKVINISKMKVYADVSEYYLTKINKGDKVELFFPALNRNLKAPINQIGNTIDANNRTFRVRINLNNDDKMIKPNLISIIKLRDYLNQEAIVVPSLYIKEDFNGNYTYIVTQGSDKNIAKKVYVKTGVTNNNVTEIVEGLTAGMQIISEGFNQVSDGTVLKF